MRHIISILLQNEAGALARVAAMFSSRGYNIDSLSVAPTHDPAVSRLTLVTSGSDAVIEQIIKQARKVIDVVEIVDLSSTDHLECELLMLKIEVNDAESARSIVECVRRHRAAILDESESTRMIQLAGTVFFNISTFAATRDDLSLEQERHLIWAPDVWGSVCFLLSSWLAFTEVSPRLGRREPGVGWWIAALNLAGSVAFGAAAIASRYLTTTGEPANITLVNLGTFAGALCFLAGALLLPVESASRTADEEAPASAVRERERPA